MIKNKIIPIITTVLVAGGVVGFSVSAVSNLHPTSKSPETSSTIDSSSVPTSSIALVSSSISSQIPSKEETAVSAGIDEIQKATDDGVSKIEDATSSAVAIVKQAASSAPVSSKSVPTVRLPKSLLGFNVNEKGQAEHVVVGESRDHGPFLKLYSDGIDTTNKVISIRYVEGFLKGYETVDKLKSLGVSIKDASGKNVDFLQNGDENFKITYTDIANVSTLYFCLADQQIKITVTQ